MKADCGDWQRRQTTAIGIKRGFLPPLLARQA